MMPFECYKTYVALKTHFTKDSYDYIQYRSQRIKAKKESFYGDGKKRKPRKKKEVEPVKEEKPAEKPVEEPIVEEPPVEIESEEE